MNSWRPVQAGELCLCLALLACACSTPHGNTAAGGTMAPASSASALPSTSSAAPSAGTAPPSASVAAPSAAAEPGRTAFALTLAYQGGAERRSIQRRLGALSSSEMQRRTVTARSFTQLGSDRSAPVDLRATLAVRPDPQGEPQRAQVLVAVVAPRPETPLEVLTELLPQGFLDKTSSEAQGFARSLLPSTLLDVVPSVPLGIGASWSLSFDRQEDGRDVHSVREYRLTRVIDSAAKPWADDGPLTELEFTWRDSAPGEPASITSGVLWHSPRWLYPLAQLRNQAKDAEIQLITELRVEHPNWGELPGLPQP